MAVALAHTQDGINIKAMQTGEEADGSADRLQSD